MAFDDEATAAAFEQARVEAIREGAPVDFDLGGKRGRILPSGEPADPARYPTWDQIAESPEYQKRSAADQEATREQYWQEVVLPQLPRGQDVKATRALFDQETRVAKRDLPAGVQPSAAGGGRGTVNPRPVRVAESPPGLAAARPAVPDPATSLQGLPGLSDAMTEAVEPISNPRPAEPVDPATLPGGSVLDRPATGEALRIHEQQQGSIAPQRLEQMQAEQIAAGRAAGASVQPSRGRPAVSEQLGRAVFKATANERLAGAVRGAVDAGLLVPEMGFTTGKLFVDMANLATLSGAQPVSDWLAKTIEVVQNDKSLRYQGLRAEFGRMLNDPSAGVVDVLTFMAANPVYTAEIGIPSVPSVLVGAGGARLGAALAARAGGAGAASSGAALGAGLANVGMNAGATFSETRGDVGDKLTAAGAAAAGTALAGRLGGAERALAGVPGAGGAAARGALGGAVRTAGAEAVQESAESLSQSLGQGTAEGNFDPGQALKQAASEGVIGGLIGGAAGAVAAMDPTQQRAETLARFDELAAANGLNPKAADAVRKAAQGQPADAVKDFLRRATDALAKRGLWARPPTEEDLGRLDQPTAAQAAKAQADAEKAAKKAEKEAAAAPSPAAAPAPAAPADDGDFTGLESDLDAAAHQAATSPRNDLPEPTDAQKEAGNYQKGHVRISGLDVSIENPAGSVRRSKADDPNPWEVTMPAHYGYIRGTEGADGDHVDLFIGKKGDNGRFWIIDQNKPDGGFDEHKVVTGVDTPEEAVELYKASFSDGFGDRIFASIGPELDADYLKRVLPALSQKAPVTMPAAAAPAPQPTAPAAPAAAPVAAPAAAAAPAPAPAPAPAVTDDQAAAARDRLRKKLGTPAPAAPQPEPWSMTRGQFVEAVRAGRDFKQLGTNPTPLSLLRGAGDFGRMDRQAQQHHEAEVTMAVARGQNVPDEVLNDYPSLRKVVEARKAPAAGPPGGQGKAADSYEQRSTDRIARAQAADTPDAARALLDEEYADGERHFEGTSALERAVRARLRKFESDAERARKDEEDQQRFEAGQWVEDEALSALYREGKPADFQRALDKARQDHPDREYWAGRQKGMSWDMDRDVVRYRKKAPAAAPSESAAPQREGEPDGQVEGQREGRGRRQEVLTPGAAPAAAPPAVQTGTVVTGNDGKPYVRFGDDRAAAGPFKSRAEAQAYADAGRPVPPEPPAPPPVDKAEVRKRLSVLKSLRDCLLA